jgi:hypothetical protein
MMHPEEFANNLDREASDLSVTDAGLVEISRELAVPELALPDGFKFQPEHHGKVDHDKHFRDGETKGRIRRVEHEISRLMALDLTYTFGGGRNCGVRPCKNGPGDCSWFASRLCDVLGVDLDSWLGSTYSLANEGKPGKGRYFTLMIKNPPDPHEAHVIVEVSHGPGTKHRHAECGGSDNPTFGNGPAWVNMPASRLAEFPIHRHFQGL